MALSAAPPVLPVLALLLLLCYATPAHAFGAGNIVCSLLVYNTSMLLVGLDMHRPCEKNMA